MIVLKIFFTLMMMGIVALIGGALIWEDLLGRQANERFMSGSYATFIVGATGLLLMIMIAALFGII